MASMLRLFALLLIVSLAVGNPSVSRLSKEGEDYLDGNHFTLPVKKSEDIAYPPIILGGPLAIVRHPKFLRALLAYRRSKMRSF